MGGCSVVDCRNRFTRGKLHFYRFPKDVRRDSWIKFTRKGNNFQPKGSSTICEVHFEKKYFAEKKDRVHLTKDAVPTILFKPSKLGLEKLQLLYDPESHEYIGQDSAELLRGQISVEDETEFIQKRQQKLEELKSLCRFCFCSSSTNENKCVPITQLNAFKIELNELLQPLRLTALSNDLLSELVCEQCFQKIIEIDAFQKKCHEAYEEVFAEIEEFEKRIEEIRSSKAAGKPWSKSDIGVSTDDSQVDTTIEILEEHLVDDDEFDNTNYQYEQQSGDQPLENNEQYIEEVHDGYKIIYQHVPESAETDYKLIGESQCLEVSKDDTFEALQPMDIELVQLPTVDVEDANEQVGVDEYQVASTDDIIKNPVRNRFCFRIYECFFCKLKFAGRKTYIAHKCLVSEIKCDQCDKSFSKIQAYNSHVAHVHGSLPLSKHFCPLCKTVIMSTLNQFKQHRRHCNEDSKNKPIQCEVCSKMCNSLKGYTVHKLFHETRNFTTSSGEKIVTKGLNSFKGVAICEFCGKDFQSAVGYRMHLRNVHRIGQAEGEVFQCHVCSKICPTKRSLFDHMRNSHRIQESACNICSKVFRTKILLKKHMMYHDETKRVYKCKLCPDKPAYFTNVALKRHQKSHVGSRDYLCDFPSCEAAYTTNHQLKIHKMNKHGICFK